MKEVFRHLLSVGYHFDMWHNQTGSVMRLTCGYEIERGSFPLFWIRQRRGRNGRINEDLYVSDSFDETLEFWLGKVGYSTDIGDAIGHALYTYDCKLRVRDTGDIWRRELVFERNDGKDTENVGLTVAPFYLVQWFEVGETHSGNESVTTRTSFWDSSESFRDAMKVFVEQLEIMVAVGA